MLDSVRRSVAAPRLDSVRLAAGGLAVFAAGCFSFGSEPPPPPAGETGDACFDFEDDDGDGLADCADPDCLDACAGTCSPTVCTPGDARCLPGTGFVEECDATGVRFCRVGRCDAAAGQACDGVRCTPAACAEASVVCDGTGALNRCVAGAWADPSPCAAGQACEPTIGECRPVTCVPGIRGCASDSEVFACGPLGVDLGVVEVCKSGKTCADGACVGPCSAPGACEYLYVDGRPPPWSIGAQNTVMLANGSMQTGEFALQIRVGAAWSDAYTGLVGAGSEGLVLANHHLVGSALAPGFAQRFVSTVPLHIHVGEPAAAFAPWPVARLGLTYRVLVPPHADTPEAGSAPAGVAVLAASNATTVTITTSAPTVAGIGIPALAAGDSWTEVLAEGDVLQLETAAPGADLTGTSILASSPVAVLVFHVCAPSPIGASCGPVAEQLPPVERWGLEHVVPVQAETTIRILADGPAAVSLAASANVTGLPASPLVLAAGESVTIAPAVPAMGQTGGVWISSDAPVLVGVTDVSVSLVFARPFTAWQLEAYFAVDGAAPGQPALMLARTSGSTVALDGTAVGSWSPGPSGFEVAVAYFSGGAHRLTAAGGVQAWIVGGWLGEYSLDAGGAW